MVNCKILENGDLLVTAGNETRQYMRDIMNDPKLYERAQGLFDDLFDGYTSNGSYTPFDAGNGDPFVGLTCAPCIAEAMNYDDEGKPKIDGRLWFFPNYMIRDPLKDLKNKGRVVFTLVG